MSRYRKIEVRTWSDEKFRALSGIPPSGQGLWFFLLTGPHTTAIPGLFRAGRAAMAEELDWEQEAFDEAFREVSKQGMAKADFKARLVWLPKAVLHNKPESPNVVRGWRVEMDLLPECELKREAIAGIRAALEAMGAPYVEAFDEIFQPKKTEEEKASPKPSSKPSAKAMANQEQEQEQEQETPLAPQGGGFDAFWECWPKNDRKQDKAKCAAKWSKDGLDAMAEKIVADVEAKKATAKWRDGFIEAPIVYLNNRRWEDGAAGAATGPKRGSDEYAALHKDAAWWREAGFPSVYDAIANRCWHNNADQFRDGHRIEVPA